MKIFFSVDRWQAQELNRVGIAKDAQSFRICLCHHWRHFWGTEHNPLEEGGLELALQLALTPSFLNRKPHVELLLLGTFALPKDDQMMRPR